MDNERATPSTPSNRLISMKQAGDRIGLSVSAIRKLIRAGHLRAVVFSPVCVRIREAELDALIEERTVKR